MYEVKDKQTNKQTVLHWPAYTALMFTDVYCTALYFNVLSLVHNPSVSQFTVMYQLSVSPSVSHSVSQSVSPVLPSVLPSCTNQSFPSVCRQSVRLSVRLMSVSSPVSPSVSHTNLNKLNINININFELTWELKPDYSRKFNFLIWPLTIWFFVICCIISLVLM